MKPYPARGRDKLVAYVRAHPGQTATQIARGMGLLPANTSSQLCKAVAGGWLERRKGDLVGRAFTYRVRAALETSAQVAGV